MLSVVYHIVGFVILIGVLVCVHELGHFLMARWAGMRVYQFSIGFPPYLFTRTRNGVVYSIGSIPLGGFVRIAGMEPGDEKHPEGFGTKSLPWRFGVLVAGVVMNILLAAFIFMLLYCVIGVPTKPKLPATVDYVEKGMPAEKAGFQPGDQIVSVNRKRLIHPEKIREVIRSSDGKEPLEVVVRRGDRVLTLSVKPLKRVVPMIGVIFAYEHERVGLVEGAKMGARKTYETIASTWALLKALLRGDKHAREGIGGPLAIIQVSGATVKEGLLPYLEFMASLSVSLALLNILPIPALDGGRILFLFVDGALRLVGRRLDPRREAIIHLAGFAVLILLILIVSAQDLGRWVGMVER
ncbi:MAG: M50 family metallopeptidase [Abditibacteriales bacterium]|nr:M50 family metallopeptidase [Abditibacteriales bacterium]MDW8365086.1 M50 family metallopeptidase [Abditibacteriales bacterium]